MAKDIVIVVHVNEDGEPYIHRLTKMEFLKRLKDHYWGEDIEFQAAGTVPSDMMSCNKFIVIDGDVIEPRPVKVVEEYEL